MVFGLFYGKRVYEFLIRKNSINKLFNNTELPFPIKELNYFDGLSFDVQGQFHKEKNFHRLPGKYEAIVSKEVWNYSLQPAGISILFNTDSPVISAKWVFDKNSDITAITKGGASGLDLYCYDNGHWQFVNSVVSRGYDNESLLISGMDTTSKEFLIYLPLTCRIESFKIGINKNFTIYNPDHHKNGIQKKRIVFYGTSVTQGGRASRPGMAYPSIISRKLNVEAINLGFSDNGRFEPTIGHVMSEIDAELYVIDCTPNSSPELIKKNSLNLIRILRKSKPSTPILLIESIIREYSNFTKNGDNIFYGLNYIQAQNRELKQSYENAINEGITEIYYLESAGLTGTDHDATVDGIHLSDLGHYRIAENVSTKIIDILKPKP